MTRGRPQFKKSQTCAFPRLDRTLRKHSRDGHCREGLPRTRNGVRNSTRSLYFFGASLQAALAVGKRDHHADTFSFFFLAFSTGGREILKAVLKRHREEGALNARTLTREGSSHPTPRHLLAGRADGAEVAEYCTCGKQRTGRTAENRAWRYSPASRDLARQHSAGNLLDKHTEQT